MNMLAARYYGKEDIRVERINMPLPQAGEVLVKVAVCGICGSDLRTYSRGSSLSDLPVPRTLGHEFAGTVAALGEGVTGFSIGDRVSAAPASSCGECYYCRKGMPTLCLDTLDFGTTQAGAFAEYVIIPAPILRQGGLVKISDEIPIEKGSMLEPLGTCVRGLITQANLQPGESVVIIGDGPIGGIQVMLSKYLGAEKVICVGHHDDRLSYAKKWGADVTIHSGKEDMSAVILNETDGMGADLVVVSVPSAKIIEDACALVRGGGRLVIFGGVPKGDTVTLDPNIIHYKEVELMGTYNCTAQEFKSAVEIANHIPLEELISKTVTLENIREGFSTLAKREAMKVLVTMQESY